MYLICILYIYAICILLCHVRTDKRANLRESRSRRVWLRALHSSWPRRGRLRGLAIYRLGAAAPSRIYDFGLDLRNGLDCDLFYRP